MPWRCAAFVWRCAVRSASTTPRRGAWSRLCDDQRSGTVPLASSRPQGEMMLLGGWGVYPLGNDHISHLGKRKIIFKGFFSGWWFQIFFIFNPYLGEDFQFDEHIFQMGWFNHQLVLVLRKFPGSWFWRNTDLVSFKKMLGDVIYYNMF